MLRIIKATAVVGALAFATTALAQETTQQINKAAIEAQKKAIVANSMELTADEDKAFWPVYEAFQTDLEKINKKRADLINEYMKSYAELSNEQAKKLLGTYLSNSAELVKLRESFVPKFEKVLPETKVLRYYQIENKLAAIIDFEVAGVIPLAR